jgi:hypothetical protein
LAGVRIDAGRDVHGRHGQAGAVDGLDGLPLEAPHLGTQPRAEDGVHHQIGPGQVQAVQARFVRDLNELQAHLQGHVQVDPGVAADPLTVGQQKDADPGPPAVEDAGP